MQVCVVGYFSDSGPNGRHLVAHSHRVEPSQELLLFLVLKMNVGLRLLLLLDINLLNVIGCLKTSIFFERGDRLLFEVGCLGCLLKFRRCFNGLNVV